MKGQYVLIIASWQGWGDLGIHLGIVTNLCARYQENLVGGALVGLEPGAADIFCLEVIKD